MRSVILLLMLVSPWAMAQNPHEQAILTQAYQMAAGLINGDYKTVAAYTHPNLIRLAGGTDKVGKAFEQGKGKIRVVDVSFGKPSALVKAGKERQCVVPQTVTIQLPQGSLRTNSSLIAFSGDGGKHWVFADTQPGIEQLRKVIPTISRKLVIPAVVVPKLK